jgi:hypothetical protein
MIRDDVTTPDSVDARDRFGEFARSMYFEQVVAVNRLYLAATIPDPLPTEETHWALSCLPTTNGNTRFSCISMHNMETLGLTRFDGQGRCVDLS